MSDSIDAVSNSLQQMKNVLRQLKAAGNTNVERTDRLRKQYGELATKVTKEMPASSTASSSSSREWDSIRADFKSMQSEFQKLKGSSTAAVGGGAGNKNSNNTGDDESSAGRNNDAPPLQQLQVRQVKHHHGLETELAYQQARLRGIAEIEGQTTELNSMFSDVRTMLDTQQSGLSTMERNVDTSVDHVKKGTGEIRKARGYQ